MKIALCLSGQPRSFEKGYQYYYENLLTKFDVDVFIHTWKRNEIEKIRLLYNPISILVEDVLSLDVDSKYTRTPNAKKWPPRFTVSSFYSIFRCCLLKIDHEIKTKQYDWVVKTRFDFALPVVIPFDKLQKDTLYMPPCRTKAFGDWLGNDQFAIGDSYIMNAYMSTYLSMERYYNSGCEMIGEEMLRANIIQKDLQRRITYIDMPEPFPPGPHNGTPHFLIRDDYEQWVK